MPNQKKKDQLPDLAWEVVKYQHEWDDNLSEAITNLDDYLKDQIVTKIRTDMSTEEKAKLSEPTIIVREKYKPLREIKNPDYNPNKLADSIKTLTIDEFVKFTDKPIKFTNSKHKLKIN